MRTTPSCLQGWPSGWHGQEGGGEGFHGALDFFFLTIGATLLKVVFICFLYNAISRKRLSHCSSVLFSPSWQTYQSAMFQPGPRLNLILGPNGEVIMLGGHPN